MYVQSRIGTKSSKKGSFFDRISKVVARYDGVIDKFIGDAVMALFGVPQAHEDDPVRAIRAAREIHDLVAAMSPEVAGKTKQIQTYSQCWYWR